MPHWAQIVSECLPLTHFGRITNGLKLIPPMKPSNIRPITMKMVLLDRKNHTILAASTNAGSTLMLGTRWGLSVVFVSLATLLIGVGEARSQAAQLQVCNQSNQTAYVAVARHAGFNDPRLILSGWYNVGPDSCNTFNIFIPWGDFYLYADGDQGGVWSGNDTRFCVTDQAFSRWVDPSPGCPPGLYIVGFNRYYTSGTSVVTWTLNP
jgi:uncharacterized membrane protein